MKDSEKAVTEKDSNAQETFVPASGEPPAVVSNERGVEEARTLSAVPGQKRRRSKSYSDMTLDPSPAGAVAAEKDPASASACGVNLEVSGGQCSAEGGQGGFRAGTGGASAGANDDNDNEGDDGDQPNDLLD